MSGATTAPAPTVRDQVIADAKSLPDLIARAQKDAPDLAAQLTAKPLAASKTMYGTAASLLVSWAITKWGLGWDANTAALASGIIVMIATGLLRAITASPIAGIFRKRAAQ